MAIAETPGNCSVITSQTFKLFIFDLEDALFKPVVFFDVNEIKNITVGEFLDYLENVQKISLSSHLASVKALNPPKDAPPFAIVSPMTPLCLAIDVSYDESAAKRQYTFYVGAESIPQQTLMKRFLKGLVLDNHTGLFKMGTFSPVIVDATYQPVEELPTLSIFYDKNIIETVRTTESTKSSKNEVSVEISAFILSGSAKYAKEQSSTSKNSIKTKSAVASLINTKTGFFIDENRIDLNPVFIKKLYNTVDNDHIRASTRTEVIVKTLNKYGWYVPNHYSLGGRLDVITSVNESSASDEAAQLEKLEGQLKLAYGVYSASLSASSTKSSSSVNMSSYYINGRSGNGYRVFHGKRANQTKLADHRIEEYCTDL